MLVSPSNDTLSSEAAMFFGFGRNKQFGLHIERDFQQVRLGGLWISHAPKSCVGIHWTIWLHQTRIL